MTEDCACTALQAASKRYHTLVFGCQMNVRDAEVMGGILEDIGYLPAGELGAADLVIVNTCSVRHSAENKVYGKIGELNRLKRRKPGMVIAVAGCMAQLKEARQRFKKLGVDLIIGTHNVHELPILLEDLANGAKRAHSVWDRPGSIIEDLTVRKADGVTAFVNIMYGCNNYCSYCIVPYVRGQERSREPARIIKEIEDLVAQGVKEVTLLGQNVNSYGRGLSQNIDFAELLERVNDVEGLERIRYTTSHPRDMNEPLLRTMARLDKVCEHVHAPIQSGSNRILKLMNRGYSREYYLDLARMIRDIIPGAALSTDLIVGFPGEEEADFEDTLELVSQVRFDAAFTFIYSMRTGTRACDMPGHLSREEKTGRLIRLNEVQYHIAEEENARLENQIVEVLVEGESKTNAARLTGRTRTNRIVVFDGDSSRIGSILPVRITAGKTFTLFGEIMENASQQQN